MEQGYLSDYFSGIGSKILSAVETDGAVSHQHELNGVAEFKRIFGSEKKSFDTRFIYFSDTDPEPIIDEGIITWYDSRENHPTRSEYRLYYTDNTPMDCAAAGDTLFLAVPKERPDSAYPILVIITERNSNIGSQLTWLFGITTLDHPRFSVKEIPKNQQNGIGYASRIVLDEIGIMVKTTAFDYLDDMLQRFDHKFPPTRDFSEYARSTLKEISVNDDADSVVMAWMEREDMLFRTMEEYLIRDRIQNGFGDGEDIVDSFVQYALSVLNRRKSRAGQALENHLEQLFINRKIRYDRTKVTENHSKPDFIFPSIKEYKNDSFNTMLLTMLGVKTTCKDRWRQVLSEAEKITNKHLLTLEAAISENQTGQMKEHKLSLVVPRSVHSSYKESQQKWLLNIEDFLEIIQNKQNAI